MFQFVLVICFLRFLDEIAFVGDIATPGGGAISLRQVEASYGAACQGNCLT